MSIVEAYTTWIVRRATPLQAAWSCIAATKLFQEKSYCTEMKLINSRACILFTTHAFDKQFQVYNLPLYCNRIINKFDNNSHSLSHSGIAIEMTDTNLGLDISLFLRQKDIRSVRWRLSVEEHFILLEEQQDAKRSLRS